MNMQELIEKLNKQPQSSEEDLHRRQHEWLDAVNGLFREIEGWLAPAIAVGALKSQPSEIELDDPDLGKYTAPMKYIAVKQASGPAVRLEPISPGVTGLIVSGRRLTGLRGRVDLISGPTKIPLVRTQSGIWKAVPLRGEPRDLTEESFAEMLNELLF
jgi:hypothetical protein